MYFSMCIPLWEVPRGPRSTEVCNVFNISCNTDVLYSPTRKIRKYFAPPKPGVSPHNRSVNRGAVDRSVVGEEHLLWAKIQVGEEHDAEPKGQRTAVGGDEEGMGRPMGRELVA